MTDTYPEGFMKYLSYYDYHNPVPLGARRIIVSKSY
jgi:hypothetical protein